MRRISRPQGLGRILDRWVRKSHRYESVLICRFQLRWSLLVGHRIAERTRPVKLAKGVLTIHVANSAWLNELSFLKDQLCQQINTQNGSKVVYQLRLKIGSLAPLPQANSKKESQRQSAIIPPEIKEKAYLEAEEELKDSKLKDEHDELRAAMLRARAAQLISEKKEDEST